MTTEHQEQSAFVKWLRVCHPNLLVHSIPNGANLAGSANQRGRQWNKLKAEGALAGVPDLFIPELRLYIEMKTATGRLTESQKKVIPRLESAGYQVAVCKGHKEAIALVSGLLQST
jgi:hypothetical protein